jgi:peptide/nickel transport system permease protein
VTLLRLSARQSTANPISRRGLLEFEGILGGALLFIVIFCTLFAHWISPYSPNAQDLEAAYQAPSAKHLFGTDGLGRDMLARVLYGGQHALIIVLISVVAGTIIGVLLGVIAGYYGGWADQVCGRLADIQLAMPVLLLGLVFLAFRGVTLTNLTIVMALATWPSSFRLVRSQTMIYRTQPFVEATAMLGGRRADVFRRHLLPNLLPLVVVTATISFYGCLIIESSLSYLGLGVQPPTPDWGQMVAAGQSQLDAEWWLSTWPGIALLVTVLGAQLFGDWLGKRLSVRGLSSRGVG